MNPKLVEEVARLIDPRAWATMDQYISGGWPENVRHIADEAVAPSITFAQAAIRVCAQHFAGVARERWKDWPDMEPQPHDDAAVCADISDAIKREGGVT